MLFIAIDEKWDINSPILNKKRICFKYLFCIILTVFYGSGNKTTPCFFFPSIFTTIG